MNWRRLLVPSPAAAAASSGLGWQIGRVIFVVVFIIVGLDALSSGSYWMALLMLGGIFGMAASFVAAETTKRRPVAHPRQQAPTTVVSDPLPDLQNPLEDMPNPVWDLAKPLVDDWAASGPDPRTFIRAHVQAAKRGGWPLLARLFLLIGIFSPIFVVQEALLDRGQFGLLGVVSEAIVGTLLVAMGWVASYWAVRRWIDH